MIHELTIDGTALTLDQVITVAHHPEFSVHLAASAIPAIQASAQAVDRLLAKGEVAYGINTGFGAFKDLSLIHI